MAEVKEDEHEMTRRIFSQSDCELSFINGMINQMKKADRKRLTTWLVIGLIMKVYTCCE